MPLGRINSVDRLFAVLGAISGGVVACAQLIEGISNPAYRWAGWAVPAALLWLSVFVHRDRPSSIVGMDGESLALPNPWRPAATIFALVFSTVLVSDVIMTFTLAPVAFNPIRQVTNEMPHEGYTTSGVNNVLFAGRVNAIGDMLTDAEYREFPFNGIRAETLIEKRSNCRTLVVRSLVVRVRRFEAMPEYRMARAMAGAATIEAVYGSFILRDLSGEEFPWEFEADFVSFDNMNVVEADDTLPIKIDDIGPTKIRFSLHSRDSGVYWVEPILIVSSGIGNAREVVLSDEPIPVGFAELGSIEDLDWGDRERPGESDRDFDELAVLTGKDKSWIPWPPITDRERKEMIESLEVESSSGGNIDDFLPETGESGNETLSDEVDE